MEGTRTYLLRYKLFRDVGCWGHTPTPSICADTELTASPPPFSYSMGKGDEETGSSASAQTEGRGKGWGAGSPTSHISK